TEENVTEAWNSSGLGWNDTEVRINISNLMEASNASEDVVEDDNETTEPDANLSNATEENIQVPNGSNGSFVVPEDALLGNISANDSDVGFGENLSDWTLVESHSRLRIDLSLSMDEGSVGRSRSWCSVSLKGVLNWRSFAAFSVWASARAYQAVVTWFALLADFRIRPDSDAGIDEAEMLSDTLLQGPATQQIASYLAAADSWQGVLDETPLEQVEISQTTVSSARVVLAPEGSEVTLAPLTLRATTTLSATTASRTTTVSTTQTMETNDTGANESVTTSQWNVVAGTECNTSVLTLIPLAILCLGGLAVGVAIRSSVELLADPARALCDVPCLRRRLPALTAGRRLGHAPLLGRQPVVPWLPPLFHWTCRPKQRLEIGRAGQEGDASPLAVRAPYWQASIVT
ncbi:unnamed protein product, partial [Symbiodinium sp. KB8]